MNASLRILLKYTGQALAGAEIARNYLGIKENPPVSRLGD
jgi:hypothetical protein